jgi:hypothetical protein
MGNMPLSSDNIILLALDELITSLNHISGHGVVV